MFATSDISWVVGHSLHRWPADQRLDHHVRAADSARSGHLVEDRQEYRVDPHVLVADAGTGAEVAGSGT